MSDKKILSAVFSAIVFFCCSFAAFAQNPIPADWKTYSGANFSFRYPPKLTLKVRKNQIELSHRVKFRHTDPCDASDNPMKTDLLEDFNMTLTIEKWNGAVETGEVTKEGWETMIDGLIDTGNLQGSVTLNTVEGCGRYVYSFPGKTGKILKIERLEISLFNPTSFQYGDDKRALKLKSVINPAQEKSIFKMIIESIKFR